MDNLRQQIEPALHRKGVPIKKMCQDIGITEQTFHRGMRENSMSMKTFRKIKEYLEIDDNTNEKVSSNEFDNRLEKYQTEWNIEKEAMQYRIGILTDTIKSLSLGKFRPYTLANQYFFCAK